ncbi:MAG: SUMF1/EgtB/PvdO family nonheme iron enzyme [Rhodomicrobium sp.]
MAEIFISYKSERRKAAAHLAKILERYGYTVWFDYNLVKGRDFAAQIDAQIREAKAVIVLWCHMSVRSEWVADEASLAVDLEKLVPAKIEPCELRVDFRRKDYVDLTAWSGGAFDLALHRLLDALNAKTGRPPQPAYEALREYDEIWRGLGAPTLKTFALEAAAVEEDTPLFQGRAAVAPVHSISAAERDWRLIENSTDPRDFRAFIDEHKSGLLVRKAQHRLDDFAEAARAEAAKRERKAEEERQRNTEEEGVVALARKLARAAVGMRVDAAFVRPPGLEWFVPGAGKSEGFKDLDIGPEMVVVPAGSFSMGSPPGSPECNDIESPQHTVTIAKPFAIGRFAITFAEWDTAQQDNGWQLITGRAGRQPNDYGWGRGVRPVIDVDWDDAKAYVKWLSQKTGRVYRLPSEAEWEYACRAGTTTPFWWGQWITPEQANYHVSDDPDEVSADPYVRGGQKGVYRWRRTLPVNSFEANPWGLYQVHGNVLELCEDLWHSNYHGAPGDGSAWTTGGGYHRVGRGGSWMSYPSLLRSAFRRNDDKSVVKETEILFRDLPDDLLFPLDIGFRVARTL